MTTPSLADFAAAADSMGVTGRPYYVGGTVTAKGGNGAKFGISMIQNGPNTDTAWASTVTPIEFGKCYMEKEEFPTTVNPSGWKDSASAVRLQYLIANGARAALCFKPAFNPPTSADQASMQASITAFKNAGLTDFTTLMWQEPEQSGAGFPTGAQYTAMYQFHYSGLSGVSPGGCVADLLGYNPQIASYFPGPPTFTSTYCDALVSDYYGNDYHNGSKMLSAYSPYADGSKISRPGCYEMGNSAAGSVWPQSVITQYMSANMGLSPPGDNVNSMEAYALLSKAAGLQIADSAWYSDYGNVTGPNQIALTGSPPDFRIALVQELAASVRPLRCAVGVNKAVGNGDTIWVFALATAGTVTRVGDTQGNQYNLVDKEQGQSGCTLWTFQCPNAQPATGSGKALLSSPMDVIQVDYSSKSSVQAVIVVGDNEVSSIADIITGTSGLSGSISVTGTPSETPANAIFAAAGLTGTPPTLGGHLSALATAVPSNAASMSVGWRTVTSLSPVTVIATQASASWAAALVSDPTPTGTVLYGDAAGAADGISVSAGAGTVIYSEWAGAADAFQAFPPASPVLAELAAAADALSVFNPAALLIALADQGAAVDDQPGQFTFADAETRGYADLAAAWDGISVFTAPAEWVLTATSASGSTVTFQVSPGSLFGVNIAVGQTFQLYTTLGGLESPQIYTITAIG